MKKFLLSLGLLCVFSYGFSGNSPVSAKLEEAVVFFEGAELRHKATVSLTPGENELTVTDLSPLLDENTLKIKIPGSAVVTSYEYSVDHILSAGPESGKLKTMRDSLDIYKNQIQELSIRRNVNDNMLEFLGKGIEKNVSGSENGLGIDELVKTMDYYKEKSTELEKLSRSIAQEGAEVNWNIKRLEESIRIESVKNARTTGTLRITVASPGPANGTCEISYYTPAAGWVAYYDVNILSTDQPVRIATRSMVRQTTGLNWDDIRLTLSTTRPGNGKAAPLFRTWFLSPIPEATNIEESYAMQNRYSYEPVLHDEIRIAGSAERQEVGSSGTAHPLYIVNGTPRSRAEFEALDPTTFKTVESLYGEAAMARYGEAGENGVVLVTLKSSMDDYVTSSDNLFQTEYKIDLPYSVPGNGKVQNIDLGTTEARAEFKFYCAPKLDRETYLLGEIADWESIFPFSGTANLSYDGMHLGNIFIDASTTHDKLGLTLGTENRVAVKRETVRDYTTTRTLGNDVQQVFTYKITVKNNFGYPVRMVVKDQYPVSTQKNIEVTLRGETTPWTANVEELGVLTWEEEFAAGESKEYTISFSVKYPKGTKLNL